LPIQKTLVRLFVITCIQENPRARQERCCRIKPVEAIARFGIAKLVGGKTLNRVQYTPIHDETMCPKHIGKRAIPREES
jgi:hypothetical protein